MAGLASVPLRVAAHDGQSLAYTLPEAATDGNASPLLGKGWRAKATGPHIALEARPRRPVPIAAVDYALRSTDGSSTTARVFAEAGGRWYPVAQVVEDGGCAGYRRLRLLKPATVGALRIEITPETHESAVALHELWVEAVR